MNFSLNNWGKQNTPKKIQKIGDISILIGLVAGSLIVPPVNAIVPIASELFGIDAVQIVNASGFAVTLSSLVIKVITKFFGYKPEKDATKEG